MTNSTRCALLAKQACTTLSHVVQKITPPSANNFLKLFFALFAMLALNVGNAWGEESLQVTLDFTTNSWGFPNSSSNKTAAEKTYTSGDYSIILAGGGNSYGHYFNSNGYLMLGKSGATLTLPAFDFNTTKIVVTGKSGASESVGQNIFVGNTAVSTATTGAISTNTYAIDADYQSAGNVYILKVTSAYNTQITKIEVYGESNSTEPPTPTTQYTIKWHTAKGVTTDVTLNEGATITEPATDPTMTGYEFMGWTTSCDVASDGSDFTAIEDFGTADSDKDFYAVFAVATTTGGGTEEKDFSFNITKADFNTTSYDANNNEKTSIATASDASTMEVKWTSYQVMQQSSVMQWQKNKGYIFNSTDLGTIKSVEITQTDGTFTTYYGTSQQPSSGTTVGNGYFQIKIGNATGKSSNIKVTFTQTVEGGGTTTYSDYITTCASGIEYIELGDAFKWSAAEAEVTIDATDNVFPTLTNTHNVPVTYSSSDDAIATIASDGTVTLNKEGTVTITAKYAGGTSAGTDKEYKAKSVTYSLTVKPAPLEPIAGGVIDILDNAWTELTNSDYKTVDAKTAANTGHSNAQYTAQCAGGNSSIQLRSNNSNSGIVSTVSGGLVKRVEIEWNDATSDDRTLNIYGSNTPYTNPTDLYDTNKDGDKLGTIVKGTSTHLEISEDYRYIGLRSASGAMYLTKVTITWLPINSKVTIDGAIQNGSVSVSGATDLNAVAAGTELTLSNTPATGYKLSAYDVYKTDDNTTKVTVTDGKFIMPEFDVTISATFELAKTLTGIEITTHATQTTFWQNETFNHNGLKVTAHFDGADDEDVTDKVTVTGSTATAGAAVEVTVSYKEGEVTETTTYNITVKATANTKETAYDVATAREIIDKVSTADNVYVTGIVSEIVTPYNLEYGNITYNISADGLTTSNQLQAFRGKSYNGENFTSDDDIQVGDEVVVFGNLLKYSSTYELNAGNQLVDLKRDKQQAGLAYAVTELAAEVGATDFAEPELTNPNGLSVEYSTSDATLATVNASTGDVTIGSKAGTVTITASFAGNEDYVAGEASYTINVTDPNQLEVTFDATIDLDANNTAQGEGEITKAPITFACTDGILGNGSEYRIYANAKATFSAAEGYIITKIVLTSTASGTADKGPGHLSTEEGAYTYSGKVGTWVGEAYTVTLSASAQVRATTITVYYKQDNRANAELAWSEETVSLTVGDAFTAPTLNNPNSVSGITYKTSNKDVATVSDEGVIALVDDAVGTATITASFAGNATYKPATATCKITINEYIETIDGEWQLVTDASKLQIGMEIIIASVADADGTIKTMGVQNNNNRGEVSSTVSGDMLNPAVGTTVITLEDCITYDGLFALKTNDGYLYAAAKDANQLKSQAGISEHACWTITITEGKASIVAAKSTRRNVMRYNSSSKIFSCYDAENTQKDIAIYAKVPDCTREIPVGYYGTVCLPSNIIKVLGATLYEVAGKEDNGRVVFDEVLAPEAGMPYIFLSHNAEVLFYCGTETATEAGKHNSLQGTFNQIDPAVDNILVGNYMVVNNVIKKCGINCGLQANRAYFTTELESLGNAPAQMPGRRRVTMGVTGENGTTDLDNITTTDTPVKVIENGQLIIIRDGVKYNVQGVRL